MHIFPYFKIFVFLWEAKCVTELFIAYSVLISIWAAPHFKKLHTYINVDFVKKSMSSFYTFMVIVNLFVNYEVG